MDGRDKPGHDENGIVFQVVSEGLKKLTVPAVRVHDEHLAVEVKKGVEDWITRPRHSNQNRTTSVTRRAYVA